MTERKALRFRSRPVIGISGLIALAIAWADFVYFMIEATP
jgi:hypothetical protein